MIIVSGIFDVAPGQREAFLESKREQVLNTRDEAGCLEYAFSADGYQPDRVRLFERWESFSHLEAHISGLRASDNPVTPVAVESTEITVFEANPTRPPWA
jgi:quinol monooxygenase YgiN